MPNLPFTAWLLILLGFTGTIGPCFITIQIYFPKVASQPFLSQIFMAAAVGSPVLFVHFIMSLGKAILTKDTYLLPVEQKAESVAPCFTNAAIKSLIGFVPPLVPLIWIDYSLKTFATIAILIHGILFIRSASAWTKQLPHHYRGEDIKPNQDTPDYKDRPPKI